MAETPDTERQAVEPEGGEVLSVSQLNDRIASVVQDTPVLNAVRCIGEVTDLHKNSTALYFTLTDGEAELPCYDLGEPLPGDGRRPRGRDRSHPRGRYRLLD